MRRGEPSEAVYFRLIVFGIRATIAARFIFVFCKFRKIRNRKFFEKLKRKIVRERIARTEKLKI